MNYVQLKITPRGEAPQADSTIQYAGRRVDAAIARLSRRAGISTYEQEMRPNALPISASH
jgi:hypothetical protein